MNSRRKKEKLEGWIKREGIQCGCCNKIVSISRFEIHAGSKLQQASENILVEGPEVSLLQCQLDAWKKQDASERQGFYAVDVTAEDPNDDTCGLCGDGGDLICCDNCPSTFHLSCLGFEMLPPGDWNCANCSCCFCREVSTSDVHDAGRTNLLSCFLCERKYHQNCVPEAESVPTVADNSGTSFCEQSCRKVFELLQRLIGTKNALEGGFSWRLIRRFDEDSSEASHSLAKMAECNSKIAVALAVMDECFLPIIDQRSGINLIHNVVYNCGSNFSRLNYTGFYTFVLQRGEEIISAASVRFHGTRLAEMPFIGTRNIYRRQGMARRLLDGIETALCSLNVAKLVIPAISELRDTWTNVFGFWPPESSEEPEFRSINMLVFPGTGLLQKPLLRKSFSADKKLAIVATCDKSNQDQMLDCAHKPLNIPGIRHNRDNSSKCPSDDLLDLQTSASPKFSEAPNQFEVPLIMKKSTEVHEDKYANISAATVSHTSHVAEVQSQAMKITCQLNGTKENGNLKLKNGVTEMTANGDYMDKICSNSTSHEPGMQAKVSKDSSSHLMRGEGLYDEPMHSTGNEVVETHVSDTTIKPSVASNGDISRASLVSDENHETRRGCEIASMIALGVTNESQSREQKNDWSEVPIGFENLPSKTKNATKSTYASGSGCIKT